MSSVTRRVRGLMHDHPLCMLTLVATLCAICCYTVVWASAAPIVELHAGGTQSNGILLAYDADSPADLANKLNGGAESFPVTVVVDGESKVAVIKDGFVSEALRTAKVSVGPHDLVTPGLNEPVGEFDEITVVRREYVTYTVDHTVPYETRYTHSPDVRPNTEVVEVEGEDGRYVDTYGQYLVKGEVQEEVLVRRDVIKEPVRKEVLMGFRVTPVSDYDFDWGFDENGEPMGYAKVLRGVQSTGYTASDGASTATGRPAMVGHVAVNPNVIPYGSKLFIQSPDGHFIYGYAIAADTGSALMQGSIGVDLYFDSYSQSAANGVRTVDIFVLE